jgi:transitional endoplasmic reticulum ATPase
MQTNEQKGQKGQLIMSPKRAENQAPAWAQELSEKYQAGLTHAFLLSGNTADYVGGVAGQTLKQYLVSSFKSRDLVVCWDRASGFVLPTAEQRKLFAELSGMPMPQQSAGRGSGGLVAGLNALSQQSSDPNADLVMSLSKIRTPDTALDLCSRVLRTRATSRKKKNDQPEDQQSTQAAIILDYIESVIPAADAAASEPDRHALVTLSSWGRDAQIGAAGHILILITNELHDLNERLRKSSVRWEQISIPFPSLEERAAFLRRLLADESLQVELDETLTIEDAARLTTGLRYIDLEDIVLRASFLKLPLSASLVKSRKDEIMASEFEEVLSIDEHEYGFEAIGGLTEIKHDLLETVVAPMRAGKTQIVPQGILFMGPPGTGKTRLAKALAKEANVTFVELQLSKIFSRYVGDTERRLERALEAIIAWQPALVFVDEIDQAVSRGEGGDSGVMSDTSLRGRLLWLAASNRPDLLDAALMRPGRMDKKIPILAPDSSERAAILAVLTRAVFPDQKDLPSDYTALAAKMEGYTGAEIEAVVGKAAQLRARSKEPLSIEDALMLAYERIIPTTGQIEQMSRLALLYCNDLDLVPAKYRDLARSLRHPEAQRELLDTIDEQVDGGFTRRHRRTGF